MIQMIIAGELNRPIKGKTLNLPLMFLWEKTIWVFFIYGILIGYFYRKNKLITLILSSFVFFNWIHLISAFKFYSIFPFISGFSIGKFVFDAGLLEDFVKWIINKFTK